MKASTFNRRPLITAVALALASTLTACGGGGSSNSGGTASTVHGVITTATGGSITVNGVTYSTSGAALLTGITDDNPSASDLAEGQVVTVHGSMDDNGNGTAESIEVEIEVQGPVVGDPASGTFTVFGITVVVTGDTVVDTGNGPLITGALVEVSGFDNAQGMILATRVHVEDGTENEVEIKGLVADLDTIGGTFTVNGTIVHYDPTDVEAGLTLANGVGVEVKGILDVSDITALRIQSEDDFDEDGARSEVEIENIVTALSCDGGDFMVGDTCVDASGATFEGGLLADISLNMRIEVEGTLNASNVLIAEKVKFRGNRVRATTQVTGNETGNAFMIFDTVTVQIIDGVTEIENAPDLAVIDASDRVEIRGIQTGPTTLLAFEIKLPSGGGDEELRGPIDMNEAGTQFSILGLPVTLATPASLELENDDTAICGGDDSPGAPTCTTTHVETFLAGLADNDVLDLGGSYAGGTFTADKVEIEGNDD